MIAVIAFVLAMLNTLFPVKGDAQLFVAHYNPDAEMVFAQTEKAKRVGDGVNCTGRGECSCMGCYDLEIYVEAGNEFERLFDATEVKWSKNGRLMVKGANSKSFKFAPKA